MSFPIDLSDYKSLPLDPARPALSPEEKAQLESNIALCRDAIVFFTSIAAGKGLGGHTGGPYDIVPELLIADGFMKGSDRVVPIYFDEAGHRVAIQYLMSVLNGEMPEEKLLHYREAHQHLPGHPELGLTPGVKFSSGRLGHMWPFVNGVALANPEKAVFLFGSDGSEMEGDDAEAARFAVAKQLDVKVLIDDNDVTIAGHPSKYLPGYSVAKTLAGHGLGIDEGEGEDLDSLYGRMHAALRSRGPMALINRRMMAPSVPGIEGHCKGHDVISIDNAVAYLEARGHDAAVAYLKDVKAPKHSVTYRGSSDEGDSNRNIFGEAVNDMLGEMTPAERKERVRVIDSDLEGSCGLIHIHEKFPDVFVPSGIMERGNFSAAAGFGMTEGRQGIFATFSAFLEMCVSEITMARLNKSNVICHFSHAGVDDMADNTCHFGINNMFAANGLEEDDPDTRLYFPGDGAQMRAIVRGIWNDPGLRFIFSNRSKVRPLLKDDGSLIHGDGYVFEKDREEVVREGSEGWVISFGESLYRALDAVEQLREKGVDVGLVNKPTLNTVDESMLQKVGSSNFVLVVEGFNRATGVGARYGTWLLERGFSPKYDHLGTTREGCGGLWEQMVHQGLDPESIVKKVESMRGAR